MSMATALPSPSQHQPASPSGLASATPMARLGWPAMLCDLGLIALLTTVMLYPIVSMSGLWPEDPYYWNLNVKTTGSDVLRSYVMFDGTWYRPTPFYTVPPWVTKHFIDWHNVIGQRAVGLVFIVLAAWSVYGLGRVLFRGSRVAGCLGGACYAGAPCRTRRRVRIRRYRHGICVVHGRAVICYISSQRRKGAAAAFYAGGLPSSPTCWP